MNNRQPPYSDLNASPFSGASQMQRQQLMAPRMQENTGNDYVHSPPDSFAAAGNLHYISSQWNRDVPKVPNSNQLYPDQPLTMSGAAISDPNHHLPQDDDVVNNNNDDHHPITDSPSGTTTKKPNGKGGPNNAKFRYRGIYQRSCGKWVAEICDLRKGTCRWVGTFATAEDAARAYDRAAIVLYGSKAQLNLQPSRGAGGDNGGVNSVSHHQGQVSDSKTVLEKQANTETGLESHEQGMEIGYEDKPRRLTFEDQEKKFQDEVLKLIEEQNHSEDAENSRHREKIIEIKDKYQENLLALRAQQARRREEFLKKELEGKLDKCHQSEFGNPCVITSSSTSFHGYVGPIATEVHQAYPSGHTREQSPYLTRRSQGTVERVPYPHGRVYNNTGARLQ